MRHGLWQVQHLGADSIGGQDEEAIEAAIQETQIWITEAA